jgi:hypothetical protein
MRWGVLRGQGGRRYPHCRGKKLTTEPCAAKKLLKFANAQDDRKKEAVIIPLLKAAEVTMPVPINPIDVFDVSFLKAPHLQLATHIIGIGEAFQAHHLYQDMPEGIPNGADIKEIGTCYHGLTYAVMTGSAGKKAERDAYREKAVLAASLALNWAGMRYLKENNFELITNLGADHKKKAQPRNTTPVLTDAPNKLELFHAKNSGGVHLAIGKVTKAACYYVQCCYGDPNDEGAWGREWQFTKIKGGVDLTGLEPGKVYYFRVRCLGHAGLGPWSTYVHIMVI